MDGHVAASEPDGITVVSLPAEIDYDSAGQVRAALAGALTAGVTTVVADMIATVYCSLEGIRALLQARRAAKAAGAQFRLAAVQPEVRRTLERTGITSLLLGDPAPEAVLDGQGR